MPHFYFFAYFGCNILLAILFDRLARLRWPKGPRFPEFVVFYIVFATLGLLIVIWVLGSSITGLLPSRPRHRERSDEVIGIDIGSI